MPYCVICVKSPSSVPHTQLKAGRIYLRRVYSFPIFLYQVRLWGGEVGNMSFKANVYKTNDIYLSKGTESFMHQWHLGSWKSAVCTGRLETQESLWCGWSPKPENSLRLGEAGFLFLFRPSADWMRPTQIMEGTQLYPKFTNLNLISSTNTLPANT